MLFRLVSLACSFTGDSTLYWRRITNEWFNTLIMWWHVYSDYMTICVLYLYVRFVLTVFLVTQQTNARHSSFCAMPTHCSNSGLLKYPISKDVVKTWVPALVHRMLRIASINRVCSYCVYIIFFYFNYCVVFVYWVKCYKKGRKYAKIGGGVCTARGFFRVFLCFFC
jgi:hypothetical protein